MGPSAPADPSRAFIPGLRDDLFAEVFFFEDFFAADFFAAFFCPRPEDDFLLVFLPFFAAIEAALV